MDAASDLKSRLERITLESAADGIEDQPKVPMMTVHAAKGLEFDSVFLTGMEEEMFPFRGLDPAHSDELEEERRLAYVAITRARYQIVLIGHRAYFASERCPSELLCSLATSNRYAYGIAYGNL